MVASFFEMASDYQETLNNSVLKINGIIYTTTGRMRSSVNNPVEEFIRW